MRNLKRALSLAVASVMLLGMMVVGTGASYKDVTSENHQEAIEVLQAVGIMSGDDKGNFNPDQNVTRNEMAVVMSNLMDYRVASYKGTSPFTDVPEWAEPFVAACYTNGITAGYSATIYGGNDTVTTAQAALMLMKALGYFQYQSDFADDWQLATVAQGNKIDLFEGVDSGVREPMTRNELAQLVLNTLKSGMVEADDDTIKVVTGDTKVEAGKVNYVYVTSSESYAKAIKKVSPNFTTTVSTYGYIVELGEKLYKGDLKLDDTAYDGFNAPANKWTYKSSEVGTYAEAADLVFQGEVKSKALYSAVGKTAAKEYDWAVYLDGDCSLGTKKDNNKDVAYTSDDFQAAVVANNAAGLKNTGNGTVTSVYLDDDKEDVVVTIVRTYAAEITKVEDETITLDDANLEFDVEGYEEEDVVLYTKSWDGKEWSVETVLGEATYVEGTVGQVKDVNNVIIDGTTYKYNTTVDASDKIKIDSYDETVAFYLDQQGYIVLVDDAIESGDYAYVISMGSESDKYGENDITVYAKMVLADGSIVRVEVDDDDYVKVNGKENAQATIDAFEEEVVAYTVNDDGTYSLTVKADLEAASTLKIKKGTTAIVNGGSTLAYGDANTIYLYCNDYDDDEYTAYVGYKAVADIEGQNGTQVAVVEKKGVAKFVFITGAATKMSADDVVFVIGRTAEKPIKSSVGTYYEYKAIVNGETTTIKVKDTANSIVVDACKGVDKSILTFYGMTVNSKGLVTDLETVKDDADLSTTQVYNGVKRASSSGLIGFEYKNGDYTKWLGAEDDAIVAYYEPVGNSLSDTAGTSSLVTDADDVAYVVTYEGSIIAIVVVDY